MLKSGMDVFSIVRTHVLKPDLIRVVLILQSSVTTCVIIE